MKQWLLGKGITAQDSGQQEVGQEMETVFQGGSPESLKAGLSAEKHKAPVFPTVLTASAKLRKYHPDFLLWFICEGQKDQPGYTGVWSTLGQVLLRMWYGKTCLTFLLTNNYVCLLLTFTDGRNPAHGAFSRS